MNCCPGTSPVFGKGWISEKLPEPEDTQYVALQGRRG
jgi:hypothetical protein